MAPKPSLSSDNILSAPDPDERDSRTSARAAAARVLENKPAPPAELDDEDQDEDNEALALDDDEDDEDLVVFTAKEAAGALSTIYSFVKPYLANYKKIIALVGCGVVIETLFNVIMPLSLKFLIDDALG